MTRVARVPKCCEYCNASPLLPLRPTAAALQVARCDCVGRGVVVSAESGYIARVVASLPPLTTEQARGLAVLFVHDLDDDAAVEVVEVVA